MIGIQRNSRETTMRSKIALRLAALALGAVFASAPALAQEYLGPPQSPGIGPNGDPRYGLYNEAPGYYGYSAGGYVGGVPGGYYAYSPGGYLGSPSGYNYAPGYYGRYSTQQRGRRVYNYSRQRTAPMGQRTAPTGRTAPARAAGAGTAPTAGGGAAKQPMGRP